MEFPSCCHIAFINLVEYIKGKMSTSVFITLLLRGLKSYWNENTNLVHICSSNLRTEFTIKPSDFFPWKYFANQMTPYKSSMSRKQVLLSKRTKRKISTSPNTENYKGQNKSFPEQTRLKKPRDQPQQKFLLK